LIKRTDTETPSPVQVITAQDLKDSGYTNVSDVLRIERDGAHVDETALTSSLSG